MKYSALIISPLFILSCSSPSTKVNDVDHLTSTLSFCYGVTGLAKTTVINKNKGMSLEEQQAKRKKMFSEYSEAYILINDIAKNIYASDLTNSIDVSIDAHASCLKMKSPNVSYHSAAMRYCPMQGGAIDMAGAARKADFTKTGALALINKNYSGFSDYFTDGYKQMIQDVYKGKLKSGKDHYADCMYENIL